MKIIDFNFTNNCLMAGRFQIEFPFSIRDAKVLEDKIIVLLSIPYTDSVINNIYAVNDKCEIVWRSQDLKSIYPNLSLLPYEYMDVIDNIIIATDFYGIRYFINPCNGKIIKREIGK